MAGRRVLALCVITLLLLLSLGPLFVNHLYALEAPTSIFIVYAPRANLTALAERLTGANVTGVFALHAEPDVPPNPDFIVLWVLTGRKPDPHLTVLNVDEIAVNRTIYLWRNAALLDIPFVNPEQHNYTINPRVSNHSIQPRLFSIPINGSVYWEDLATNVATLFDGTKLEVRLDAYNTTMVSLDVEKIRELGPRSIKVNKTTDFQLEYYVVFYLVNISEVEGIIKLFFPGALPTTGFASEAIKPLEGVNVHWYTPLVSNVTLLKELPGDAATWWVSKTLTFTSNMIMRTTFDVNTSVYHIYAPHLLLAQNAGLQSEVYEQVKETFVSVLASAIREFMLAEERKSIVVVFNAESEGVNVLIASNVGITPDELPDFTVSQLVGILLTYSGVSLFPHELLLREAGRAGELSKELSDTRTRLLLTESELNNTKSTLASCEAELEIARTKLLNIEELAKEARTTYTTALLYMTTGFIATVVVAASLGYLAYVIAKKRK